MLAVVEKAAARTGGIVALARELGITHNALYSWREVPSRRVLAFEKISGISRHDLRPDLYPRERPIKRVANE